MLSEQLLSYVAFVALVVRELRRLTRGVWRAYRGMFNQSHIAPIACLARGAFQVPAKSLIKVLIGPGRKCLKTAAWYSPQVLPRSVSVCGQRRTISESARHCWHAARGRVKLVAFPASYLMSQPSARFVQNRGPSRTLSSASDP
jgi:hypothetical protein